MIYCVEDDDSIRELVVYTLRSGGFEAKGFSDGNQLDEALRQQMPALLLLDVMLPGEDGVSILRRIRASARLRRLPVILATAKGAEYDKVIGLDSGADDYIAKPFGMMELLSRVKAVLRRCVPEGEAQSLTAGEIHMQPDRHMVTVSGQEIMLTLKEFELLRLLMSSPGRVFTRDMLIETLWGYDFDGETRTVDVHVRTLRQKLGSAAGIIETVRGVGYRLGEGV
ncbi:winged helix-turn-helix domain-containing protein [Oscillospiraceae bacterium LTW-04]|nr:response regulator transcription factor [Oscillospiraceae bacterium MB24-C1]